jgi:transposase
MTKPIKLPKSEVIKADLMKIGIDVHAHFVVVARQLDGSVANAPIKLETTHFLKWIEDQQARVKKVVTCYEAGPTGFWLHRRLASIGVTNYVVCPTSLDSRKKGVNTDKTDAKELLNRLDRYLAGNHKAMSIVRVPSLEEEQRRAITRQRDQLRKHRLSLAAQGRTLMLLHGWRQSNLWWMDKRWQSLQEQLPQWIIERLIVFRELIEKLNEQINSLTAKITKAAPKELPVGVGALTHEIIDREVGDWTRFKTWRQVGSYAGLTGGVSASGSQSADLSITKAGNKRLRTALIELSWRLLKFQPKYWLVKKWACVLCDRRAHSRRRRRAIVAFARQLIIDLWKWKTGKASAQSLGLALGPG